MFNLRGENCNQEAVGIKFLAIKSIVREKVPVPRPFLIISGFSLWLE